MTYNEYRDYNRTLAEKNKLVKDFVELFDNDGRETLMTDFLNKLGKLKSPVYMLEDFTSTVSDNLADNLLEEYQCCFIIAYRVKDVSDIKGIGQALSDSKTVAEQVISRMYRDFSRKKNTFPIPDTMWRGGVKFIPVLLYGELFHGIRTEYKLYKPCNAALAYNEAHWDA